MKLNFQEIVKQKTDKELEIIAKDIVFYSEEERLIAFNELESRNSLTEELLISKKDIEFSREIEGLEETTYKIKFKDLFPQKNYLITPILIYANVFVFALMVLFGINVFMPSTDILVQWGGNIRYLTINGQLWRLFTSIFLHSGILHLAFNMYALLYVGSILEKAIGRNKFIFAYLISGIAASISSLMIYENIVSVGASGAIFGLFGVLLPLLVSKEKGYEFPDIPVKNLALNTSAFVLYNIIIGFGKSGIDNAAHIGGLFTGAIIGILYSMMAKEKIRPMLAYIILLLTIGIFSTLVITNVSDKFGELNKVFEEFSVNEEKALWMYRENIDSIPDSLYEYKLTKEGIDIWDENIALFEKIKNNGYDEPVVKLIDMFIDYSTLRKKSCELMIESLENNSPEILQKLEEINIHIGDKLMEIEDFYNTTNNN